MSQTTASIVMAGFPGMRERRQWEFTWDHAKPGLVSNPQLLLDQNPVE